ncbi:MAG: polysaccharide deacetylase family protein [Pseudomonadota bacterium]
MLSARSRQSLDAALRAWRRDHGHPYPIWWRDDDAADASPALARLRQLSIDTRSPVALAVVPALLQPGLGSALAGWSEMCVWQHGYAHQNRAPAGAKKAELGDSRPVQQRLAELALGRARLSARFGRNFQPVLVPPWNRISDDLIARLPEVGLRGLSTFRPRPRRATPALTRVNTHVDVIAWRLGGGFVGEEHAVAQLLGHWQARAEGRVDPTEATGILTHHRVHDEATWRFLTDLFHWLREHPCARVMAPRALFALGTSAGRGASARSDATAPGELGEEG